ncbi:MAG: NADH-quinone oxidoreductase subunit L [Pirellulaceae bacterium]|nr:NADH-quinone oxidoreductase subunit L [Pirellulaceae bacterium]
MFDLKTLLILVLALPLAAALAAFALGPKLLRGRSHAPVVAALVLGFVVSVVLLFQVGELIGEQAETTQGSRPTGAARVYEIWSWAHVPDAMPAPEGEPAAAARGDFNIGISLRADPLTAVMLAMVACISALVAVYSVGYMHGDRGYWRFFAYVGLFVFSMNLLVAADNFLLLYVGWELVGLCSYLLIGFWYDRPAAAAAGKKAFLVNRIGDAGFALGIFLIWTTFGALDFEGVFVGVGEHAGDWRITAICLLLFCGACGKSAQFPLHVWLPDAMEGPTPVSALIHAATMVTAGVYMVARCTPLFAQAPDAQIVVASVGGATALLGAVIAVTQTDLKRILAYSTISHLGYMFVALGTGTLLGITAGMFHLVMHAFFKALLFLGAGSVMHAAGGVIDIRRLGGLRRRMPVTYWTFLAGALSMAGALLLSGFWSKDAILLALDDRSGDGGGLFGLLFISTLLGVVLIDFYIFRPFFIVFHGEERLPPEAEGHAHESPPSMTVPLVVLAFGSIVAGGYFEWTHGFADFLSHTPSFDCLAHAGHAAVETADKWRIGAAGSALSLLGIALVAALYLGRGKAVARMTRAMNVFGLYGLSYGKFFFDPIYNALIVRPMLGVARVAAWLDRRAIDALVDLCGLSPKLVGALLRPAQNGLVQFYALAMAFGVLILLGIALM